MDLIERQAAIDALNEQIEQCNKALGSFDISLKDEFAIKVERASLKAYREQLENLPTVHPEIIHCKDCKRFKKPSAIVDADWGWCSGWHTPPTETFVKVDGFCHRAEKRVNE